ncbi:ABC transporter [Vallitalea longa]|uniref:ABC transporter n=1 Tax=Vallitalea longa TaxID=2936439 RepID=A0A9W5YDU3_9FIRM|nr:ABC transporter ATP-binding protein [Vallitalea longa]GKX32122.1 ABC transporter [Vallitalea longa]
MITTKKFLIKLYHNIFFIIKNTKTLFAISLLFYVLSGFIPYIHVTALSTIIREGDKIVGNNADVMDTRILYGIIMLAIAILVDRLLLLGQMPLASVLSYQIKTKIECLIVEKTSKLSYEYVESSTFQTKIQAVYKFANQLPNLYKTTLQILKSVIIMVSLMIGFQGCFYLAFIIMVGCLPKFLLSYRIRKKQHELDLHVTSDQRLQEYYKELLTKSQNVKEKQLFGLKGLFTTRWENISYYIHKKYTLFRYKSLRLNFFGDIGDITGYMIALVLLLLSPSIDGAGFLSLSVALMAIQNGINAFIGDCIAIRGQVLDDDVVYDFLKEQEDIQPSCDLKEPITKFTFDHVNFTYKGSSVRALDDVNVTLNSGETVVIVGENGAGKTTFIKMLLGLYPCQGGKVLCNNQPVNTLNRDSYFRRISTIFQHYNKYPFTIAQNIEMTLEEEAKPTEDMILCAKETGIHDWVCSLPNGYNTLLTHLRTEGIEVSGGEWQKIAIARGQMKPADVFIMDEPTASLDPLMEAEIMNKFMNMDSRSMKIIVSHRVGIATKADKILVFKKGKLVEVGCHKELIQNKGVYAQLYEAQAKWYTSSKEGESS